MLNLLLFLVGRRAQYFVFWQVMCACFRCVEGTERCCFLVMQRCELDRTQVEGRVSGLLVASYRFVKDDFFLALLLIGSDSFYFSGFVPDSFHRDAAHHH